MIQDGSRIVPIEVKSEENLKSKSLSAFLGQNANAHGIRFSMSPYREQERMTNVPLYGAGVGLAGGSLQASGIGQSFDIVFHPLPITFVS